jgi:hypothetical protein
MRRLKSIPGLAALLLIIYLLVGCYGDRRHLKPYRESRHV